MFHFLFFIDIFGLRLGSSPSVSLYVEEEQYDDNVTPLIPIIPVVVKESTSMNVLPELVAAVKPRPCPHVQSQLASIYISGHPPLVQIVTALVPF